MFLGVLLRLVRLFTVVNGIPHVDDEFGIRIEGNLAKQPLHRDSVDIQQRRDAFDRGLRRHFVRILTFVELDDQGVDLLRAAEGQPPHRREVLFEIDPGERLAHAVDHVVEREARPDREVDRIRIRQLQDRRDSFVSEALREALRDSLDLLQLGPRFFSTLTESELAVPDAASDRQQRIRGERAEQKRKADRGLVLENAGEGKTERNGDDEAQPRPVQIDGRQLTLAASEQDIGDHPHVRAGDCSDGQRGKVMGTGRSEKPVEQRMDRQHEQEQGDAPEK